jgi:mannose-1-phosphate guanylyltransferase
MKSARQIWAVVLAAGDGTRLAALTVDHDGRPVPKQFCSLMGGPSLLAEALQRARTFAECDRICVVVAHKHQHYWRPCLAEVPAENIFVQPENRGTAHGVLLPLLQILRREPSARITFLPADHHVAQESALAQSVRALAAHHADPHCVGIVGIPPDRPDPELGYILPAAGNDGKFQSVQRFVEKPDVAEACRLIAAGALWNSFIFAAEASLLLRMMRLRIPESVARLEQAVVSPTACSRLVEAYRDLPSIDFSRTLMQHSAEALRVITAAACGWSDLGTPHRVADALRRMLPPESTVGNSIEHNRVSMAACINLAAQHALLGARN